ncbi:YicC family protein [Algicella marina]|uniref:YicC family protein n=2 Tax=Algicella marina TaxID=2683284 RepID=A0A6P1T6A8_9RHOB|nr:YicC family protein [Algicella marina]
MTGYASVSGSATGLDWVWEARSVNARGLDIRVRVPEGAEALEADIRKAAPAVFSRGTVSVSLRVSGGEVEGGFTLNSDGVQSVLAAALSLEQSALQAGVNIAPLSLGDLLGHRMVVDHGRLADRLAKCRDTIAADIPGLLADLDAARAAEGDKLRAILAAQVAEMARLTEAAATTAEARAARAGDVLRARVQTLLHTTERADEARLQQELALLAVKSDVTEELDRLRAHIATAHELLAATVPIGRKLDFLMQEFNREANTLCSKAGAADLTAIGLDLKVVIDQMREQSANVE